MRQFFILAYDSNREDLEVVSDYEMGAFDLRVFWRGERFRGSIPDDVRLWVIKGKRSDYLANPVSWAILSKRFWALLEPFVGKDAQLLSPPLYDERTRRPVTGYLLMNLIRCIDALRGTSEHANLYAQPLRLDLNRVPANVHVFRLAESKTRVLVSDAIVQAIWGKGLRGIALIKTESVAAD
jgi:hypothetical protein